MPLSGQLLLFPLVLAACCSPGRSGVRGGQVTLGWGHIHLPPTPSRGRFFIFIFSFSFFILEIISSIWLNQTLPPGLLPAPGLPGLSEFCARALSLHCRFSYYFY